MKLRLKKCLAALRLPWVKAEERRLRERARALMDELDLTCVERIIAGGAASPPGLVRAARERFGAAYSIRYSSTESGGVGLGTDFDAPDDEPVLLLIFLLVPEAATQRHLEILSEIAEMLSDRELRERTLVIVVGDHGEVFDPQHNHYVMALKQPTLYHHGWSAYDEILRVPLLLGMPLLLHPVHIVLLELVIDPACSIAFEAEAPDPAKPADDGKPKIQTTPILTAADDPIIPVADFHALRLPPNVELDIAAHGGHCGFLDGAFPHSFVEPYATQRVLRAFGG